MSIAAVSVLSYPCVFHGVFNETACAGLAVRTPDALDRLALVVARVFDVPRVEVFDVERDVPIIAAGRGARSTFAPRAWFTLSWVAESRPLPAARRLKLVLSDRAVRAWDRQAQRTLDGYALRANALFVQRSGEKPVAAATAQGVPVALLAFEPR